MSFANAHGCVVLCCFDSACPLRNDNMYAIVRRINRICNLVSLQRVFALLPRRNSRNDNLSTCLAWQTVAAMMKKNPKKTHVVYSFTYLCIYLSNTYLLYELSYQTLSDSLSSLSFCSIFAPELSRG